MRSLHDLPMVTDSPPLDAEVLIEEARRRQRHRWIFGSIILTLALIGTVIYAVSSAPPGDRSTGRVGSIQQPYFAGTTAEKNNVAADISDLIRPDSIAVEPNGDLLIADDQRNQIFERTPNGDLKVFAGTGAVGYSRDGESALDANFTGLGDIVLSSSGTLYVAENLTLTFTGSIQPENCRIQTVADGHVRTLNMGICVVHFAFSPQGVLYASDGQSIYRIAARGAATRMAVTSPDPLPGDGGSAEKFAPCGFVFEPNGDLIVDSAYYLEHVTAAGVMTTITARVGGDCEGIDGMTMTPNGAVLLFDTGGKLQKVVGSQVVDDGTILPKQIGGYGDIPVGKWQISDTVTSSDGTIYAIARDEDDAAGPRVETQLIKIPEVGRPSVVPVTTPLITTLPAVGMKEFPSSLYPAGVRSSDARLASCPNSSGIEPFNQSAKRAVAAMFANFKGHSFFSDLRVSDRSWWPGLFDSWKDFALPLPSDVFESVRPASTDPFAQTVESACSSQLVNESLVVHTSPGPPYGVDNFLVLDRDGHPLVYFQGS